MNTGKYNMYFIDTQTLIGQPFIISIVTSTYYWYILEREKKQYTTNRSINLRFQNQNPLFSNKKSMICVLIDTPSWSKAKAEINQDYF